MRHFPRGQKILCDVISCVDRGGKDGGCAKSKSSGKYCVAGGPGLISCTSLSQTPGVSMHLFPSNEVTRWKWTKFVQKRRPGFKPTKTSVLCSIHFAPESFPRRIDFRDQSGVRRLEKGAFPTIDVAVQKVEDVPITERERRKVSFL